MCEVVGVSVMVVVDVCVCVCLSVCDWFWGERCVCDGEAHTHMAEEKQI